MPRSAGVCAWSARPTAAMARSSSIRTAEIFAALLGSGESVKHELEAGRKAWVQVVRGAVEVNGEALKAGDGAAVENEGEVVVSRARRTIPSPAVRSDLTSKPRRAAMPTANAEPGKTLLTPTDHTLIMIDFQSQMAFATKSIDPVMLRNNAGLVANAAEVSTCRRS